VETDFSRATQLTLRFDRLAVLKANKAASEPRILRKGVSK